MDPASEPTASSQALSSNLARSRSRYKGAHPNRPLTSPAKTPSINADQVQQFHKEAPPKVVRDYPSQIKPLRINPPKKRGVVRETRSRRTWSPEVACQFDQPRNNVQTLSDRRGQITEGHQKDMKEQKLRQKPDPISETPTQEQREKQPAANKPPTLPTKSLTQRITGYRSEHRRAQSKEELKRMISAPIANDLLQDTRTPTFDAPVSAVNAGERRVIVKYGESVMSIRVVPSTTPTDIIRSAAEQLSKSLSPKATVVLESFKQLGLERPLRRYEHVRNVMNSWDNDLQNTLVIIPSPTGGQDSDLDLSNVSSSQPGETSAHIYHSQKPGNWDKRWVTLRSDGQVIIARKNGGETANICHLSDFDIYIPTARQIAKQIKPPRKVCFVVKSQQKSSMFMSTENFVHFFSTSDKALASAWYRAVQEWRSWYLVVVMGEGKDDPKSPTNGITSGTQGSPKLPLSGTAQPGPIDRKPLETANEPLPRRLPTRSGGAPPTSYPKKLTKDATTGSATTRKCGPSIVQTPAPVLEPEPFASTGLLGRTYTLRQKAQREREAAAPDLPPGIAPMYPEESTSTSLRRASSQHQKPKPLIDLTPQYQEPPQHQRKGRGIIPAHIPPEGLIGMATSPESAIPIPPTTSWQRPRTSAGGADDIHRTRTMRSTRPTSRNPSSSHGRHASTSPEKPIHPFMEGGLLSDHMQSQGSTGTGRGGMTGDQTATKPLLDVGEESQFGRGSLLERVERFEGEGAMRPVIEREKRTEVDVRVGEGF